MVGVDGVWVGLLRGAPLGVISVQFSSTITGNSGSGSD